MADLEQQLQQAVLEASESGDTLYLQGGGSKTAQFGRHCEGRVLDLDQHQGVIDYQPSELVLTARTGTSVSEAQQLLAQQQQTLAFEPPEYDGKATLGGTLACNLSGPARPWAGSIRDAVLGIKLINGRGQLLRFGGQVMKNVAGYDVSRLQAGALGSLGLITEVSLKVLPLPESTSTRVFEMSADEALKTMNQRAGQAAPLSAACWHEGRLYLRLSGAQPAVEHCCQTWGGELVSNDFWRELREQTLPFFNGSTPLWRLSLQATTALPSELGEPLIDWLGAQRFYRGDHTLEAMSAAAKTGKGWAQRIGGDNRCAEVRSPLNPVEVELHRRLKSSFDPAGILNPGIMFREL
jgi:glycolate oxidase FAD binding subunit